MFWGGSCLSACARERGSLVLAHVYSEYNKVVPFVVWSVVIKKTHGYVGQGRERGCTHVPNIKY